MFEFTCVKIDTNNTCGFIHLTSLVYFKLPEDTTSDDIGSEQCFLFSFTKESNTSAFALSGINNIYWNDSFIIPSQALEFIVNHYTELLQYAEASYATKNALHADDGKQPPSNNVKFPVTCPFCEAGVDDIMAVSYQKGDVYALSFEQDVFPAFKCSKCQATFGVITKEQMIAMLRKE